MEDAELKVQYPRPKKFSDPWHEWSGPEGPSAILATDDESLTWQHFQDVFHWDTPVGTYEEIVYFLPLALQYMLRHPEAAFEYQTHVVYFFSKNAERLQREGLLAGARRIVARCFANMTETFSVRHYDSEACSRKGWSIPYCDIVEFSEIFYGLAEDLVRYKIHADLAVEAISSLAHAKEKPISSAWFLEFVREIRQWQEWNSKRLAKTTLLDDEPNLAHYELITKLVSDKELIQYHAKIVLEQMVPTEPSPTYWSDLFYKLGL